MAGYNHETCRSNNYEEALTNQNLLTSGKAVIFLKKNYQIVISAKKLVNVCNYAEWHHYGSKFAKNYFFAIETLNSFGSENKGVDFKKSELDNEEKTATFKVFEEYRGKFGKKLFNVYEENFKGIVKSDWLHLENGTKKSLTSKNFICFVDA